eukprot:CAMPEP_0113887520 /NCGR_PEP_ID=MMETSP0780_2-20120614/12263_1 /TAXON_ID=652834 /ORGANISM="Palpitomonas bilix" /LENGTH=239 /DNA_ID=CAMNT_0000876069 /DNA_START=432 /DNA_END=1151 /DNA_ORIENTATION=+ /assembly_acc=CAM_ASM_000599
MKRVTAALTLIGAGFVLYEGFNLYNSVKSGEVFEKYLPSLFSPPPPVRVDPTLKAMFDTHRMKYESEAQRFLALRKVGLRAELAELERVEERLKEMIANVRALQERILDNLDFMEELLEEDDDEEGEEVVHDEGGEVQVVVGKGKGGQESRGGGEQAKKVALLREMEGLKREGGGDAVQVQQAAENTQAGERGEDGKGVTDVDRSDKPSLLPFSFRLGRKREKEREEVVNDEANIVVRR